MSRKLGRPVLVVALILAAGRLLMAQGFDNVNEKSPQNRQPEKPTGPAANKADDLIQNYTARIEKEINQGRKEVERLRSELHELIDVRYEMAAAIADLRGDLAAKGTYSADLVFPGQPANPDRMTPSQVQGQGMGSRPDLFYGLGSALPREPTPQQREQLRRLAPRADLKRMIERLRAEVEETRTEVDTLVYTLLELRAGIPASYGGRRGMGGGMGGMMGGGMAGSWFGSMGVQGGMM